MTGRSAGRRLGLALLAEALTTPALAAGEVPQHFTCRDGTAFVVVVSGRIADVSFSQSEHYRLRSKPFSLGQRFVSQTATLIIDRQLAAFVTSDRMGLEKCTLMESRRPAFSLNRAGPSQILRGNVINKTALPHGEFAAPNL